MRDEGSGGRTRTREYLWEYDYPGKYGTKRRSRLLEAQGFDHAMKQTASKQREALRYIGSRQRITCVATGEYVEWEYAECGFVGKYEWVERLNTIKKPHPLDESETKVNA